MQFLDRLGWPVERIEGRPILNFFRLCIHTRKIVRKWEPTKQEPDPSVSCESEGGSDSE